MPTDAPATAPTATSVGPATPRGPSNASVTVQFVLAGIVWGSSFLFMKVALVGLSPGQVAWSRLVLGGLTLGLFVALRRDHLPRSLKVWGHMTVLALSFCVIPFLLFSWAQQHVTSGLASIYNATTPIMTAVMAGLLFRVERLKAVQIAGILAGHPRRRRDHRALAGPRPQPEPGRPVRDPRRHRLLRVQPRLHAQVRVEHGHDARSRSRSSTSASAP